ncbi:MAG: TetR/AcrR family transcriptional regulator [Sandaracinaceae bacterium]
MPRLSPATQSRIRDGIESAAADLFVAQGYAATSTRQIADAIGITAGALYNHYPSKAELFAAVVRSYQTRLAVAPDNPLPELLRHSTFPFDIPELAAGIKQLVHRHRAYWLLWYIDVLEFGGEHFQGQLTPEAMIPRGTLEARFDTLRAEGTLRVEPELAFIMTYMQLFNYYLVETVFGARNHYGVPERRAVEGIADVLLHGVLA